MGRRNTGVNLKCDPERAEELRAQYHDIVPGSYMSKKHWNTLSSMISDALVKELIDHCNELFKV
jgi:predicted DNA-binding protein (MmcQ/YjbR family)